MQFIDKPNLPFSAVKLVAITAENMALEQALLSRGIDTISVGPSHVLGKPVCCHPDMLLHHLGGNRVVLAENNICDEEKLRFFGFEICHLGEALQQQYPFDIALNTARVGNLAFGHITNTATVLRNYFLAHGITLAHVTQGYAKCSTCIVDEHSIVTADTTIAAAAACAGLDVLAVPPGNILLDGYGNGSSGFIGGSCGLLAPSVLAFCGNVSALPYYAELAAFAQARGVALLSLCCSGPVTDVGSILPLCCT